MTEKEYSIFLAKSKGQMKENSLRGEDAKTPPPLTPKDSLSVEVEEIRARSNANHLFDAVNPPEKDLGRLLVIVDKLREQVELKDKAFEILKCVNVSDTVVLHKYADIESQLATAQAQLRRKDEALERIAKGWTIMENDELSDIARAALADGKQECGHAYKLEGQIFVQKPELVCVKCGYKFGSEINDGKE